MTGGFQVGPFQINYQQVSGISSLDGELSLLLISGLSSGDGLGNDDLQIYYVGKVKK